MKLRIAIARQALGELLGYGQRSHFEPGSVRVDFSLGDTVFAAFQTRPELAANLAAARALEYEDFLGKEVHFKIQ